MTYTSIPDTTDTDYWQLKSSSLKDRSKSFVPIDRELHNQLLTQQRERSLKRNCGTGSYLPKRNVYAEEVQKR